MRKYSISISVSKREKEIIKANAELNNFPSMSGFLRQRGLDLDISNKTTLTILLTFLSSKLKDFSPDKALDWAKRKQQLKSVIIREVAGMDQQKKKLFVKKLEETIDTAVKIKQELEELLVTRRERLENLNVLNVD